MGGHLEKRSRSSWTIVVEAGRDPVTGKRRRVKVAFRGSKRDAEREMHRILHELETGTYVPPTHMTVGEHLFWWLEHYARASTAPHTFESYEMIVAPPGAGPGKRAATEAAAGADPDILHQGP